MYESKLSDLTDDAVLLPGKLLSPELSDNPNAVQVMVQHGKVIDAPLELSEFLEFLKTPRSLTETMEWISKAGGTLEDLESLDKSGRIKILRGKTHIQRIYELRGLKLIPHCAITFAESDILFVGETSESTNVLPIFGYTADLMWGSKRREDIPTAVKRFATASDDPFDFISRVVLDNIAILGIHDLAWLSQKGGFFSL